MPDLVEQMYCSQQIVVPTMFPHILKQYAKAAIRTQPYDLLRWSASYFSAMANGEEPPVKHRIEYPPADTPSGLTPGYLRVLIKQLGITGTVSSALLYDKWMGVCLNENCLMEMLRIGGFTDTVDWLHFLGIAAGHLTDSLAQTMCLVCELLTEEPEGGSAMIPCETFVDVYTYLAALDCGPLGDTTSVQSEQEMFSSAHSSKVNVRSPHSSDESLGSEPPLHIPPPYVPDLDQLLPDPDHPDQESHPEPEPVREQEEVAGEQEGEEQPKELSSVRIDLDRHRKAKVEKEDREMQTSQPVEHLAHVPGIGPIVPDDQTNSVVTYVQWWAERQHGMTMPRNVRHFLCPPLDKLPLYHRNTDHDYVPKANLYPQSNPLTCSDVT